jgi:hypothetical protein
VLAIGSTAIHPWKFNLSGNCARATIALLCSSAAWVLYERFRRRFHCSGLTRTDWSQEQKVPDRASRRTQTDQVHLINIHDLVKRFILTDN